MVNFSKIAGMGQKKPKPKTVSSGRKVSKKKQQMGMGKGKKGLGMTNVMTGQQTTRTSKPKVKRAIDTQKRSKSPVAAQAKPKPTLKQRLKRIANKPKAGEQMSTIGVISVRLGAFEIIFNPRVSLNTPVPTVDAVIEDIAIAPPALNEKCLSIAS